MIDLNRERVGPAARDYDGRCVEVESESEGRVVGNFGRGYAR